MEFQRHIIPLLNGKETDDFRRLADEIDQMKIDGHRLHTAIRYGVIQALLDAAAQSRGLIMAEVLAEDYEIDLPKKPIRLFCKMGGEWQEGLDKCILISIPVFPHFLINSREPFDRFLEYLPYVSRRVKELTVSEFKSRLHFDLYATLGMKCENRVDRMVEYLEKFERDAHPYSLVIEEPVDMDSREKQIEVMAKLRFARDARGLGVRLCADKWCNTL